MKATIESTTELVDVEDGAGGRTKARAWEGISEAGVPFTAYIVMLQVRTEKDNSEFQRELHEHKPASAETLRAIDLRFII